MRSTITVPLGIPLRHRPKWKLLLPCIIALGWTHAAAQELKAPERLWECEVRDKETCGTWAFQGVDGTGQWNDGASATLYLQQFDPAWIIVRRSDSSGTSPGLTGIYVGKLSGDRIPGTRSPTPCNRRDRLRAKQTPHPFSNLDLCTPSTGQVPQRRRPSASGDASRTHHAQAAVRDEGRARALRLGEWTDRGGMIAAFLSRRTRLCCA